MVVCKCECSNSLHLCDTCIFIMVLCISILHGFAVCNLTHYLSGNSTGFASNDSSGAVGSVLIHKDEPTCFTYINLGKTLLLLTDGDCKL